MPGFPMMEAPAVPKGAALVSVDGRVYPLKSARIDAEASGGIVRSTLVQTYRNPYAEALETIYTMPLPADGAVIAYTMRIGERVVRGEVRPRKQARADYEKAMFEGKSATLLEQERDDTFTQRLGALPAGAEAEITIEVLHPLGFIAGSSVAKAQWEYRFPTVVSVRYEGEPGRVTDADRLDVDRGGPGEIPTRIDLKLDVIDDGGIRIHTMESMRLDRDLVVRWPAGRKEVDAELCEGPGLPGDDGRYGLITIVPPAVPEVSFARDLTIMIDASGSMHGPPLTWAKAVSKGLIAGLGAPDMFEIIAFATVPEELTEGLVPATAENIAKAMAALDALHASGGTEMVKAMVKALKPLRAESQRQVVLISDGQIGFEDEIIRKVRDGLPHESRLHVVGVGAAPNRTLTMRAARAGRGVEAFVCGDDQVDVATRSVVAATARPVLTDLRFESAAVKGIVPARPRDVMAGQPAVAAIELSDEGGSIQVSGNLAGSTKRWSWQIDVPPRHTRTTSASPVPIGALYGREMIADLEVSGEAADDRIEQVAMRHQIASRATSLVAIAEEPSIDPRQPKRRVELAVEVPAFQSAEALGLGGERLLSRRHVFAARVRLDDSVAASFDLEKLMLGEAAVPPSAAEPATPRRSLIQRLFAAFRGKRVPLRGRVIHTDGDLIVIEYETTEDGSLVPDGTVLVARGDVPETAVVDAALSSPRGPHPKGVLLRLALRKASGWAAGEATVAWTDGHNGGSLSFDA